MKSAGVTFTMRFSKPSKKNDMKLIAVLCKDYFDFMIYIDRRKVNGVYFKMIYHSSDLEGQRFDEIQETLLAYQHPHYAENKLYAETYCITHPQQPTQ